MTTPSNDAQAGLELTAEEQVRIQRKAAEVERQTHWDVLGLQGDPTPTDIKRAYFELSKQYHPDRYFGKNVGSFRGELTKIFHAIKRAYDTLGDETAQKKYREKFPPPRPAPSQDELEAHRQRILAERKKKKLAPPAPRPTVVDKEKSAEAYALGLKHVGVGQLVDAMSAFKGAVAHDPGNVDAQRMVEQLDKDLTLMRASRLAERGEAQAAEGNLEVAAQAFAQAFDLSPQKGRYGARAVELYIQAGNVKQAVEVGGKLLKLAPQLLDGRLAYAQALGLSGEPKQGMALLADLADFERQDPRVSKLLSRLAKLSSE